MSLRLLSVIHYDVADDYRLVSKVGAMLLIKGLERFSWPFPTIP